MEQKFTEAFQALNLITWATKEEVERQRKQLIGSYTSLELTSLKSTIDAINRAADLLINEYFEE